MLYAETIIPPRLGHYCCGLAFCSMRARLGSRFVAWLHSQAPRDEAMSAMLDVSKSSVDVWRIGATQHRFGHSNPACVRPVDRSKGRIKGSDDLLCYL